MFTFRFYNVRMESTAYIMFVNKTVQTSHDLSLSNNNKSIYLSEMSLNDGIDHRDCSGQ